jgi:hypothetical protein
MKQIREPLNKRLLAIMADIKARQKRTMAKIDRNQKEMKADMKTRTGALVSRMDAWLEERSTAEKLRRHV